MVKYILLCICFFLGGAVWGDDVKVSASIDGDKAWIGKSANGIIQIQHNEEQKVDPDSFQMGNSPLKADRIEYLRVREGEGLMISIYRFEIVPVQKGLQVLPAISVNVGGKVVSSPRAAYEVVDATAGTAPQTQSGSYVKLEAAVEGDLPLYPGQHATFIYRYYFNDNIELTQEVLPLLKAEGFTKIGEEKIQDMQKGKYNIRQISQEVEAVNPGSYSFGPSLVEGLIWRQGALGQREYLQPKLSSEAPPVQVEVLPFPSEGKPASFNGAVGAFSNFQVELLSFPKISVGDKVSLKLTITGLGNLEAVPIPDLCCQPGFPGMFRLSDIPPAGVIRGNSKEFVAEMRPLTSSIKEVPAIAFSWFDPKTKEYHTLESKPISLQVSESPFIPGKPEKQAAPPDWPTFPKNTAPIEIAANMPLTSWDLNNLPFGTWWSILLLPFGAAAIFLQVQWKRYLEEEAKKVVPPTAQDLFRKAQKATIGSSQFFDLLQEAFLLRLIEQGHSVPKKIPPERLPTTGIIGEVREFLCEVEQLRFSGQGEKFDQAKLEQARKLFRKI